MNRVLEYAARNNHRRGTVYGMASMCTAGLVLAVPLSLFAITAIVQDIVRRPAGSLPWLHINTLVLDGPAALSIALPILGAVLGAMALNSQCKRHQLVAFGLLVNLAGLIAAIGAILSVG
jgi:hypothetical protein